jgi:hypothetical protein
MHSKDFWARARIGRVSAVVAALLAQPASAADVSLHAMADARAVLAPDETSWLHGGFGKTRFGDGDGGVAFGNAALAATAQLTPSLLLSADAQYESADGGSAEALEAWARFRPVSVTPWRWSVKAGAFFPPVSLENVNLGWTSPWTITPSALNTWIGEELRTIGAEGRVERRGEGHTLEAGAALFWANDPAGELLAARGWSLGDYVSGLGSRVREPDLYAIEYHGGAPLRFDPYQEIDHRVGWHADLAWRAPHFGEVRVLRYDNNADPATHTDDGLFTWHTRFWSLGAQTQVGPVTLIAQGLDGDTTIAPSPFFTGTTKFHAAFLLAGMDLGAWRPALRFDAFSVQDHPDDNPDRVREHGNAVTAALGWRALDWLRLVAEVMRVDSWRSERAEQRRSPREIGTQVQFAVRVFF